MISVVKRCRSAQRRYIRRSISAQSVASVPPAPALIDSIAGRSSYSPENRSAVRSRAKSVSSDGDVAFELGLELGVGGLVEQLERGLQVVGAGQQCAPGLDLGAQAVGLAQDLLGAAAVVPEPGLLGQRLELGDARLLGRRGQRRPEVDRIRSARSRTADAST